MPIYEFRCQQCDERFEERRTMRDADAPASCPKGHADVVRLVPVFATTGRAAPDSSGCGAGGCCGGACGAA
ncbi:MAG TPA: zinc ribbon domain-containing protein [Acidimicrobiales bacterium]|jgi:putative FmdB family regulatory protein|nr:zinc ribbon domain-containing protein [Acidimicrobiales bacterium]